MGGAAHGEMPGGNTWLLRTCRDSAHHGTQRGKSRSGQRPRAKDRGGTLTPVIRIPDKTRARIHFLHIDGEICAKTMPMM